MNLQKSVEAILNKSTVKGHYRTTKSGKKVFVKEHVDKRTKKPNIIEGNKKIKSISAIKNPDHKFDIDYITATNKKHIKAILESDLYKNGNKSFRVNRINYQILKEKDDTMRIKVSMMRTDGMRYVKNKQGKLVPSKGIESNTHTIKITYKQE